MRTWSVCCCLLILLASSAFCNEESKYEFYGIELGDSLEYVVSQAEKYGFEIREERIWTETGEESALYLSKAQKVSLVVVIFEEKVHWIDVVEPDVTIDRLTVGTPLSLYAKEDKPLACLGHRDSSLDEFMIQVNTVIALVDQTTQNAAALDLYRETHNAQELENVIIKGIWLRADMNRTGRK